MDDAPPLEEARGPHLPDWMTAIHWLAWVFVVLAVVDFVWIVAHAGFGQVLDVPTVLNFAINATWSVAACLLPVALLLRHPDVRERAPLLLLGTLLYGLVQGLQILADLLEPFFLQLTPPTDELPFLIPSAEAYRQGAFLIAAVGLALIGLGLARARRYEDRRGMAGILLVLVAVVLAMLSVLDSIQQIVLGATAVTPTYSVYLGAAIIVGILRILAWSYLTAMAARGSRAGEDPGVGWWLATLGGSLVLVSIGASIVLGLVQVWTQSQDNSLLWVAYAYSALYSAGHLCLLAGLAVGLPALEPLEALDDEFESDDEYEDEADDDEVEDDLPAEDDQGWPVARIPNP